MNATKTIIAAPIRKTLRVNVPQETAFRIFLERMGSWWPKGHSLLGSPQADVIVEPRVGGRWYEVGEDGSEYLWGRVLAWDEPNRALLAWQLNGEWRYDEGFETEVEIRFVAEDGATIVEFEHRKLEAYARTERDGETLMDMDSGWGAILEGYREQAEKRA
jgi:uncharacterized protein YndB with AHSA1/START domain